MSFIDRYFGSDTYYEPLTNDKYRYSKNLKALDLLKFIMALGVVAIHTNPLVSVNPFLNSIVVFGFGRLAVPFFFTSSAWLLFRRINLSDYVYRQSILRAVKRLLIMYILWTIIYMPKIVPGNTEKILIELLKNAIFVSHLWYLISSACALLIIVGMLRLRMKPEMIFAVTLIPFVLGLLFSGYYELINKVGFKLLSEWYFEHFVSVRNALLFGLPYMASGLALSVNRKRHRKDVTIILLAVLYLMHLLEFIIIRKYNLNYTTDMTMIALPFTILLVYVVVHIDLKDRKIYKTLRNCSILIYLIHPYMIELYDRAIGFDNSIARYVFVCCVCVLFSLAVLKIEQYKCFRVLKYLH